MVNGRILSLCRIYVVRRGLSDCDLLVENSRESVIRRGQGCGRRMALIYLMGCFARHSIEGEVK